MLTAPIRFLWHMPILQVLRSPLYTRHYLLPNLNGSIAHERLDDLAIIDLHWRVRKHADLKKRLRFHDRQRRILMILLTDFSKSIVGKNAYSVYNYIYVKRVCSWTIRRAWMCLRVSMNVKIWFGKSVV